MGSASEHRVALVGIEATPGLAPEMAGRDHAAEKRRRRGARIERRRVERLAEPDWGVDPDQIEELARAHLVAEARLDRLVDVGRRRDARLDGADDVVVEGHEEGVQDEARPVLRFDRLLARSLAPGPGRLE